MKLDAIKKESKILYQEIDECITELLQARTSHDTEVEGKALFRMEGLMVGTLQHLSCIMETEDIPSNLDEAANKFAQKEYPDEPSSGRWGTGDYEPPVDNEYPREIAKDAFKAGAEWMAGQEWKEVSEADYPKPDKDKLYCVHTEQHYLLATVILHPYDDGLCQWRCTEFPHHRYDMREGNRYFEIRKK